jgi:predicted phage tail protein
VIIHLAGALERFGGPYTIKRRSAWEAWRLLSVQIPGLARAVMDHPRISVILDGECLSRELLSLERDAEELILLPVPAGADFGIGEAIAAAGIAAGATSSAGIAVAGTASLIASAVASVSAGTWLTIASTALSLGLSLAQTSAAASPKRDPNGNSKAQSYSFNGAVNTTQEGSAIPLIFGRVRTGGIIISYGQYSETSHP